MKQIIKKIGFWILFITLGGSSAFAGCSDLIIKEINHDTDYNINSNPAIGITIENPSSTICNSSQPEGFVSCNYSNQEIYKSSKLNTFVLNPKTYIVLNNLSLSNIVTQDKGEKEISCKLSTGSPAKIFKINVTIGNRFDSALNKSIKPIAKNIDAAEGSIGYKGVVNFVFKKTINIVYPIIIVLGILVSILGFYTIMTSQEEGAVQKGVSYLLYGTIGVLILMSAKYIGTVLFEDLLSSGNVSTLLGVNLAQDLYDKIAFPFLKLFIYIILGLLFVFLSGRVIGFITSTDESSQKQAMGIIVRDILAMLIIIGGKQIIEAVYGKREEIINTSAQNLGDIGSGILANKNIPIIYEIISWVLGISMTLILVIIIYQTVQLLMKPDDEETIKKIKKSLFYIFLGVIIIGAGYVITNVIIVN